MSALIPSITAIIPARYASTRLPGKPLVDIAGKPMIQHVYEKAKEVFESLYVATDDDRIAHVVQSFGGQVIMTSSAHDNGTSRIAEAVTSLTITPQYIVNIQGDEPMIQSLALSVLKNELLDKQPDLATLITPVMSREEFDSESDVFVVTTVDGKALYFSRSPIPGRRGVKKEDWFELGIYKKHLGLYAYRVDTLLEIVNLPIGELERHEYLEQNRWLEHGYSIQTAMIEGIQCIPVDTPQDLELVRLLMKSVPNT